MPGEATKSDQDSPVDRMALHRVQWALSMEPMLSDPSLPAATRDIVMLAVMLARDVLKLARGAVSAADSRICPECGRSIPRRPEPGRTDWFCRDCRRLL